MMNHMAGVGRRASNSRGAVSGGASSGGCEPARSKSTNGRSRRRRRGSDMPASPAAKSLRRSAFHPRHAPRSTLGSDAMMPPCKACYRASEATELYATKRGPLAPFLAAPGLKPATKVPRSAARSSSSARPHAPSALRRGQLATQSPSGGAGWVAGGTGAAGRHSQCGSGPHDGPRLPAHQRSRTTWSGPRPAGGPRHRRDKASGACT